MFESSVWKRKPCYFGYIKVKSDRDKCYWIHIKSSDHWPLISDCKLLSYFLNYSILGVLKASTVQTQYLLNSISSIEVRKKTNIIVWKTSVSWINYGAARVKFINIQRFKQELSSMSARISVAVSLYFWSLTAVSDRQIPSR